MITPDEFRIRWNESDDPEELVQYPAAALAAISMPDDAKQFLERAGLPESASPFLDFEAPADGRLKSAAQQWRLPAEFDCFPVIGSNGSGDPVCIDAGADGQIVYLNHDDGFRRVFMNSSVAQLAESLMAYRHLVLETQKRNGQDAYLDGDIPNDLKQWLRDELLRIDPAAVEDGCHWADELANLSQSGL